MFDTLTLLPDPEPLVRLRTFDLGKLRLDVTLFCPSQAADQLESGITCDILAAFLWWLVARDRRFNRLSDYPSPFRR